MLPSFVEFERQCQEREARHILVSLKPINLASKCGFSDFSIHKSSHFEKIIEARLAFLSISEKACLGETNKKARQQNLQIKVIAKICNRESAIAHLSNFIQMDSYLC